MPNPPDGALVKWLRFAATVSSLFIIPIFLWGIALETRVTVMEANASEASSLLKNLNASIQSQALVIQRAAFGVEDNAEEIEEWKTAIRDAIDLMTRYHAPTRTARGQ